MVDTDRRHPHRPLDRTILGDYLRGRDLRSAELLADGKSNTNYKLVLSDDEISILRIYSRGDAARESYVMDRVRDLVPVPRELHRGDGWAIFSFLEGEPLESSPQDSGAAARALARISTVTFEAPGWIEADGSVSPFPFDGGRGFMARLLDDDRVRAWLDERHVEALVELLEREQERMAELDEESCLVHGDFNPTNVLVRGGAVVGILDWEFSHAGTPYMDVGNLLRNTPPEHHDAIGEGLEAGGARLGEDWRERAALVDLSSLLEFLTSARSEEWKRRCLARIETYLGFSG